MQRGATAGISRGDCLLPNCAWKAEAWARHNSRNSTGSVPHPCGYALHFADAYPWGKKTCDGKAGLKYPLALPPAIDLMPIHTLPAMRPYPKPVPLTQMGPHTAHAYKAWRTTSSLREFSEIYPYSQCAEMPKPEPWTIFARHTPWPQGYAPPKNGAETSTGTRHNLNEAKSTIAQVVCAEMITRPAALRKSTRRSKRAPLG